MLKQVFDKEQLSKALSSSDVWKWNLLSKYGDVEKAVEHTVQYWQSNSLALKPLEAKTVKGKQVFVPANMEDTFAIRLLDRFTRRIYKVRQSDRNRIVRQLKVLLKDSGRYHVLRLDIKDCFETIPFKQLINRFEEDLILSPQCIKLLNGVLSDLCLNHGLTGLPRGLSISPTLAELYLEKLDERLSLHPDVLYCARYVDDIIILTSSGNESSVESDIRRLMNELGLNLNFSNNKYYSGPSNSAEFDYLGYSIKVTPRANKSNDVRLKISQSKLNKLKSRIALSFCDHKKNRNGALLKRRIEYLCMLKAVRKGENGDLLAGIAHNYQYVTDDFECLKPIDGFLIHQLTSSRFGLSPKERSMVKKISVYGNARKRNVGKFSRKKTVQIMQVWKGA